MEHRSLQFSIALGVIFGVFGIARRYIKKKTNPPSTLVSAVLDGKMDMIEKIILENPKLINEVGKYGYAPLHAAIISKSNLSILTMLLDSGADPNVKTKNGKTAFELAKIKDWDEGVTLLSNYL